MSTSVSSFPSFTPFGLGQRACPKQSAVGFSRRIDALEANLRGQTLSEKFADTVQVYKDKMLRGLNGMCEAEINGRIREFIANNWPECGTDEAIARFLQALAEFIRTLHEQPTENLIITSAEAQEGNDDNSSGLVTTDLLKSRRAAELTPPRIGLSMMSLTRNDSQARTQPIQTQPIRQVIGSYEQMFSIQEI